MEGTFRPTLPQHLATDYQRNLAVTAGAGTGKTAVLTRRIVRILAREELGLDRLLVLTFTDKAAVEMKERIYRAIEEKLERAGDGRGSTAGARSADRRLRHFQWLKDTFLQNYVSTFHAFCAAVLREYPIEAGVDPYFRILDETDSMFVLRRSISRSIRELAADKQNADLQLLSSEFSRSALAGVLFTVIRRREDTGAWIEEFGALDWDCYRDRLPAYRACMIREMAYKLHCGGELRVCAQELEAAAPGSEAEGSKLEEKRATLLRLVRELDTQSARAADTSPDADRLVSTKQAIEHELRIPNRKPKVWHSGAFERMKAAMYRLRYVVRAFPVEEFELVPEHEREGFALLQALSRVAQYCVRAYRKDKDEANYLDFQDLQLLVHRLVSEERHAHVLRELQDRFQFIMVDEFQDTNELQWRIVRRIAADPNGAVTDPKLFVVGDEKQAIYSFRGGDVTLFSRVRHELIRANRAAGHDERAFALAAEHDSEYEDARRRYVSDLEMSHAGEIVFADNFRSAEVPVNFINMFFRDLLHREVYEEYDAKPQLLRCSGNRARGSVELLLVDADAPAPPGAHAGVGTERQGGAEPTTEETRASRAGPPADPHFREAILIAEKIREVFSGTDERYARVRENARAGKPAVAILLNRRTMIKTYEEALRRSRIEFTVVRGRGFYQRQEVVDLGNLLDLLVHPWDDRRLVAFLRSPAGHVSDEAIFLLAEQLEGRSLWEKLRTFAKRRRHAESGAASELASTVTPEDRDALLQAAGNLERWMDLAGRMPVTEFLQLVLDEGGYYASLARGDRGDQAVSNVEKLVESARRIMLQDDGGVTEFADWLSNRIDHVEEEGEADIDIGLGGAVQIMTVHQAKGLEFPMVFVPDLGAGFNFGAREKVHAGYIPHETWIGESGIERRESLEIGLDAPNPENEWEPEPTLAKRIIRKRTRNKQLAERKRLFYVAATRAVDHLVLVGHAKFSSPQVTVRVRYAPLDELGNWMEWMNRILGLSYLGDGLRGELHYGNDAGTPMRIPYRWFAGEQAGAGQDAEYRTEFPLEPSSC